MKKLVAIALLTLTTASLVIAETTENQNLEPSEQCAALLKECLMKSFEERTNCFFSSAKHPFCDGTALGRLSYDRWSMSPNRPNIDDSAAFLGPRLIDQACLTKFDEEWAAELQKNSSTDRALGALTTKLDGCTKKITMELMHP